MLGPSKSLAALGAGLLARKGEARPAMRAASPASPADAAALSVDDAAWNDLGWNDHGADASVSSEPVPASPACAERPAVLRVRDTLRARLTAGCEPAAADPDTSEQVAEALSTEPVMRPKTAFTLRLDPDRHLRMRLTAAAMRCSAQQLVTRALDQFLDSQSGAAISEWPAGTVMTNSEGLGR